MLHTPVSAWLNSCVACVAADTGGTKTKVKFQLQRRCMFGEHFKVVGAHSTLGEWNPEAGVPLEWSDGHNWTAELEVPQGEEYEYKFVLQCGHGGVNWQPGPNRVFSTLEGTDEVVVTQTWEPDDGCDVSEEEEEAFSISQGEGKEQESVPSVAEDGRSSSDSDEEPVTKNVAVENALSEEPVAKNVAVDNSTALSEEPVAKNVAVDNLSSDSEEPATEKEEESVALQVQSGHSSSGLEAPLTEESEMETGASNSEYETEENQVKVVKAEVVDWEENKALKLWQKDRSWFQSLFSRLSSIFKK